jgi:uncharacterized membrane protein
LGQFLAPGERKTLADQLAGALARWRAFVTHFPAQ